MRSAATSVRNLALLASAFASGLGVADEVYWTGYQNDIMNQFPNSGSFFHGDNWLNYLPPGQGDEAKFGVPRDMPNGNFTHNPHHLYFGNFNCYVPGQGPNIIPGGDAHVAWLRIGNDTFVFDMASGATPGGEMPTPITGSLSVENSCSAGYDTSSGHLTIMNGPMSCGWANAGVGNAPTTGSITVAGPDASLTASNFNDSNWGSGSGNDGTLSITNGALVALNGGNAMFGREGGSGTLSITGASTLEVGAAGLFIGTGTGQGGAAGHGSAEVSDQSHIDVKQGSLLVGFNGATGTLRLTGGASVTVGGFGYVGSRSDSVGEVVISGQGSEWSVGQDLYVGESDGGDGRVTVEGGGRVECGSTAFIGDVGGANHGEATVRGEDSSLAAGYGIGVGDELNLLERGHTESTNFALGPNATLRIGVGPGGCGHAQASDIVLLDGALELVPEGELKPGDTFAIATGAQVWGEFASITPDDFGVTINGGVVSAVYKPCYADLDGSKEFNLFDFLAFVNLFNAQDPEADCTGDGVFDLFDFLCFNNFFNVGC